MVTSKTPRCQQSHDWHVKRVQASSAGLNAERRGKRLGAQEDVLEEIALTPQADPLQTPFSALRPQASQLRPILVRGSPRFVHAGVGSMGGSPQEVQLSWSSLGQEGSSQSR